MKVAVRIANPLSIRVEPFLSTSEVIEPGETELEVQGDTLWDLLIKLNDRYDYIMARFIDPQTKTVVNYDVFVNERYYESLPGGISTKLKGGDKVEITIPVLGGG